MSSPHAPNFLLKIEGRAPDELVVTSFSGVESLSRPFDFHVEFLPLDGQPLDWAALLESSATLEVRSGEGDARVVHGHVHEVELLQSFDGWPRYRLRLVPHLERLRHVRRSRVFQDRSTRQIVKEVLDEAGIQHRWSLSGSYSPREYCLQYRETDLDFVSRLLEWEGIFYFFEHSTDGHVLVLSDAAASAPDVPSGASLPFVEERGMVPSEEHFTRFERARRVRPAAVMTRDFDFKNPGLDLSASAQGENEAATLEVYDYPEGYGTPADGKRIAAVRLEERQVGVHTSRGASTCPRLSPGYTFELEAPAPAGTAGKYLAVEVRHRGARRVTLRPQLSSEGEEYRNELRCLAHGTPFRPRRRTRWPVIAGIQTATVVGPPGEEIHPDQHGRIKVQFHWDRDGSKDDHSSCFIRVGQPWAGPAWGAVFLPRIGQEVVVRSLEGDPDRPLITGAVYNGQNPAPFSLPDEKTLSTLKSSSSLGGDGFNELRLEDAAEEEEIFVHAQGDERLITENDKAQEVRGSNARLVRKDRKTTVEMDQRLMVALDDSGLVRKDQTLHVMGTRSIGVTADHSEAVHGQQSLQISGERGEHVALTATLGVGGACSLQIGGEFSIDVALATSAGVGGALSRAIGGESLESILGAHTETVTGGFAREIKHDSQEEIAGRTTLNVEKDLTVNVNGAAQSESMEPTASSAKAVVLKADKLSFVVGEKQLLMLDKSGDIMLTATTISLDGSTLKLKGTNIQKKQPGPPPTLHLGSQSSGTQADPLSIPFLWSV